MEFTRITNMTLVRNVAHNFWEIFCVCWVISGANVKPKILAKLRWLFWRCRLLSLVVFSERGFKGLG